MPTPQIALITILTDDVARLVAFYRDALSFVPKQEHDPEDNDYCEFTSPGVRFAICTRAVMHTATDDATYQQPRGGQSFELAFPCADAADVDATYATLLQKGATGIHAPARMPWGQVTAFFADPDGNIHEIFAEAPAE
ncbi:MAG: VOC family protein [Ktedonobacterales bacterium]|nr:VOC family protein [Ktedonobacterales bacterium]